MLTAAALEYLRTRLGAAQIDEHEARMMARLLVSHHLYCPLSRLALHVREELDLDALEPQIKRLEAGEPLQYVLGETEFMGLAFRCQSGVLIPRQDSEALAERAIGLLRDHPAPLVADVCTGSGAYALALAHYLPQARVAASDISPQALALAAANAASLGVLERVTFYHGDLLAPLLARGARFHLLVCNPPYITTGELGSLPIQVQHEPRLALDGGEDGLDFYRRLATDAGKLLLPGGYLLLEHGDGQGRAVRELLESGGFTVAETIRDYGRRERGILARV